MAQPRKGSGYLVTRQTHLSWPEAAVVNICSFEELFSADYVLAVWILGLGKASSHCVTPNK